MIKRVRVSFKEFKEKGLCLSYPTKNIIESLGLNYTSVVGIGVSYEEGCYYFYYNEETG